VDLLAEQQANFEAFSPVEQSYLGEVAGNFD
jgi:hypothetical protein